MLKVRWRSGSASGSVLPERFMRGPFVCHDTLVPPHMLRDVLAPGLITQSGGARPRGVGGVEGWEGATWTATARKWRHTISTESSTREEEPRLSRKARRCSPACNAQQRQTACSWALHLLLYQYLLLWAIHGASEELESPPVVPLYRCQLSPLKGKYLLLEKVCLLRKRSYRIRKE